MMHPLRGPGPTRGAHAAPAPRLRARPGTGPRGSACASSSGPSSSSRSGPNSSSSNASTSSSGASTSGADPRKDWEANLPWGFGFQMNERFLNWGDPAAGELVRRVLSQEMNVSVGEVDRRLVELGTLVPDMVGKLQFTRADILLALTRDLPGTTRKLLGLKDLFPGVNVSLLVAKWPYLLIDYEVEQVAARLDKMRQALPGVRVEALVDAEPQMLRVDISKVLDNIRRLMPNSDPVQVLVTQPQMVLDMNEAGLPSAIDVEGFGPA